MYLQTYSFFFILLIINNYLLYSFSLFSFLFYFFMNVTIIPIASFGKIGYNVAYMMGKDGTYEGFESAGLVDAAGPFRWNPLGCLYRRRCMAPSQLWLGKMDGMGWTGGWPFLRCQRISPVPASNGANVQTPRQKRATPCFLQ